MVLFPVRSVPGRPVAATAGPHARVPNDTAAGEFARASPQYLASVVRSR